MSEIHDQGVSSSPASPEEQALLLARLTAHLEAMAPGTVWRPVPGPDGRLLATGSGPSPEELAGYLRWVDFTGKSVIDLGANLGFYTFMAARGGASRVLALDSDLDAVEGGRMLARLHGLPGVEFESRDFILNPPPRKADMVLLVDFIGRGVVGKGRLDDVLDAAEACAREEIVVTLHPVYGLEELPPLAPELWDRYARHIEGGRFHLARYAADRMSPRWRVTVMNEGRVGSFRLKSALHFQRKHGAD